jgi:Icc protein
MTNKLEEVKNERLKFIVISDLHLVSEGSTSKTLDTAMRLSIGIKTINSRHSDADFCILAGDLADLGKRDVYLRLKEILGELLIPYHITIGNHDNRKEFIKVFGTNLISETGYIDKVIDKKGYRVILLDSAETDQVNGELSFIQLDWLKDRLIEVPGCPIIIVLHHHANPLHTRVDRIILNNGEELVKVLKNHKDIRQVIAGHVHYTSTSIWHGIPFTTLAGGHYNVTIPLEQDNPVADKLSGPAQMAVVLGFKDQTVIHFDNYIDGNSIIKNE